jgi:hypothetical protein
MIFLKKYRTFKSFYRECKSEFRYNYQGDLDLEYEKAVKGLRLECKKIYFNMRSLLLPKTFDKLLEWHYDHRRDPLKLFCDDNILLNRIAGDYSFTGATLKVPTLKVEK